MAKSCAGARDGKPLRTRGDYTYDAAVHKLTLSLTGPTKFIVEAAAAYFETEELLT